MHVRNFSFLILLAFFCSLDTNATTKHEADFDRAIQNIAQDGKIVGLAIAVVRKGELSSLNTFGRREVGRPELIDEDTRFRIASLSKGFAATVAGMLVNDGKLDWNDPISKFNQEFRLRDPAQANSATLSHVLSHRLSLPPYAYDNLLEAGTDPATILGEMKKVDPICRVGSCYAYQNVGFNMITSAIEQVYKKSYTRVVDDLLFDPLGMSNASFGLDELQQDDNWARSHKRLAEQSWSVRALKPAYYHVPAAGGINASIKDMAKWLAAQMGHAPQTLTKEQLRILHMPQVVTPAEMRRNRRLGRLTAAHYGLGWRIYQYAGETVINHSGSVEGYTAQIAFLPKREVGYVLLANSRSREFWDILPLFLDAELGLENDQLN